MRNGAVAMLCRPAQSLCHSQLRCILYERMRNEDRVQFSSVLLRGILAKSTLPVMGHCQ
jgi:hypothetical protein